VGVGPRKLGQRLRWGYAPACNRAARRGSRSGPTTAGNRIRVAMRMVVPFPLEPPPTRQHRPILPWRCDVVGLSLFALPLYGVHNLLGFR
jgi:hypothetical protein